MSKSGQSVWGLHFSSIPKNSTWRKKIGMYIYTYIYIYRYIRKIRFATLWVQKLSMLHDLSCCNSTTYSVTILETRLKPYSADGPRLTASSPHMSSIQHQTHLCVWGDSKSALKISALSVAQLLRLSRIAASSEPSQNHTEREESHSGCCPEAPETWSDWAS